MKRPSHFALVLFLVGHVCALVDVQRVSLSPYTRLSYEGDCSCNVNTGPCEIKLPIANHQVITHVTLSAIVQHTFRSDINMNLTSPSGTTVILLNRNDGRDHNWNVIFDDKLGGPLVDSDSDPLDARFNRTVIPHQSMSVFAGSDAIGIWTLSIEDCAIGDDGELRQVGLEIFGRVSSSNAYLMCPQDVSVACGHSILPDDLPQSHRHAQLFNCPYGSVEHIDRGLQSCPNQIQREFRASRASCDPAPCIQRITIASPPSFINVTSIPVVKIQLLFAEPLSSTEQVDISEYISAALNNEMDVVKLSSSSGPSLFLRVEGGPRLQNMLEQMEASRRISYSGSFPSILSVFTSSYTPNSSSTNVAAAVLLPLIFGFLITFIIVCHVRKNRARRARAKFHHNESLDEYNAFQRDQEISMELFDSASVSLDYQ